MPKAVFQSIYHDLKTKIGDGTYAYGSFLPSEAELTRAYDCSRSSVRRAISVLVSDGYVQSQQGKGVRVIRNPSLVDPAGYNGLETFRELAHRRGLTPVTHVLLFEEIIADDALAELIGFEAGSRLTHILRARDADGEIVSTDESFYLSEEVPGLTPEIVSHSVYAYLEGELGIKIGTSKRVITIEAVTERDREIIELKGFNAIGVMRSHTFDADGVMIEYTESRQRAGFFSYHETAIRPSAFV